MLKKILIASSFLVVAVAAQAQSTPAKKELAARIIKQQQPGIEAMARTLVEQPAVELMNNAGGALQARVPKERQEAVAAEIKADVSKYLEEATPVVQARAVRLAPSTIGALLEEKLTEDELKQVIAIMESPAYAKFQRMADEMQKVLVEKLVTETRSTIEPKVRALEATVAKRLGITTPPAAAGGAAAPKAAAPKAPAKP
ncbi:hypothetical protein [Caenimonas sp. SL110]|uniref:hypothetical protein n=1 Tax=Caenimonas sp. SL110 TaxID=1450524 RepID=UPI000A419789|nr:hypothetical protein [Caenimonas sp. SL110]